jgi:hypothetical protein
LGLLSHYSNEDETKNIINKLLSFIDKNSFNEYIEKYDIYSQFGKKHISDLLEKERLHVILNFYGKKNLKSIELIIIHYLKIILKRNGYNFVALKSEYLFFRPIIFARKNQK